MASTGATRCATSDPAEQGCARVVILNVQNNALVDSLQGNPSFSVGARCSRAKTASVLLVRRSYGNSKDAQMAPSNGVLQGMFPRRPNRLFRVAPDLTITGEGRQG